MNELTTAAPIAYTPGTGPNSQIDWSYEISWYWPVAACAIIGFLIGRRKSTTGAIVGLAVGSLIGAGINGVRVALALGGLKGDG